MKSDKTKRDSVCTLFLYRTKECRIPYYRCSKCGFETSPMKYKHCPECGRRVIAVEDRTIWQ